VRFRAATLVGFVLCAGVALPARAATTPKPVEVARAGAVKLLAGDERTQLCISLTPDDLDTTCAERGQGVAALSGAGTGDPLYVGTAVPATAANVEVRRAGVLLATGPTVAGEAYKGVRAGSVRFALLPLPKGARTDGLRVRALSAAGTLVAVLTAGDDEELQIGDTRLLSGRARDVRWTLHVEQLSELSPSVLDLAHETVTRCVDAVVNGVKWEGACSGGPPLQISNPFNSTQASGAETCNPPFRLLYGVVDGSVASVTVLLGSGRRRTLPTVPVGDGHRAYALATGTNAVRSVTMPGQGVVRPARAPMSAVCAGGGQGIKLFDFGSSALGLFALLIDLPPVTPAGPVTTIPGAPAIQVADGPADTLCIALPGKPFDGLGCGIVSPVLSDQLGTFDNVISPTAFALAVPARVATVRLSSGDGKTVRSIPTVPDTGYRGRYAGKVRFASASIAGLAALTRLELLDAAGAVLYREGDSADDIVIGLPRVGRARRIAGRAGRPSLWQTNVRDDQTVDRCLSLTDGPAPGPKDNCQADRGNTTVLLDASCSTHRLSVGIAVRAGTRVVAETGTKARRAVRLHGGAAVLTLPGGRALRALTFTYEGHQRRVEIGAPPAAEQCGWHLRPLVDEA
jgi:hypothetical protein